jgi:hypothetical protein
MHPARDVGNATGNRLVALTSSMWLDDCTFIPLGNGRFVLDQSWSTEAALAAK